MINYRNALNEQAKELDSLLLLNKRNLSRLKDLPNYRVKVSKCGGCNQYYLVDRESGKIKYANKKNLKLVKRLVQRDYENAVYIQLDRLKKRLDKFIGEYNISEIDDLYKNMSAARKGLVVPIVEDDRDFIERWKSENPGHQNDYYGEGKIATSNGGYVRSKSERIIADLLDKYQVPYIYEPKLVLNNRHIVYPDFMVLNVRERKTIYWEHLGLLSEYDYARKNFDKIKDYEEAGLLLGRELIITMETADSALNIKLVEEKIKRYCL